MNVPPNPSFLIVCVAIVGSAQPDAYYAMVERQFQGCDPRHFKKLNEGVYLVNQDTCYPAILRVIDYCGQSKNAPGQPNARLMIAELSESPIILSPEYQDVHALVKEMGRQVRLTKFPLPAQPMPNRPV